MNAFQKQLMLNDKCMAELANQARAGVGMAIPPQKISVEEFLMIREDEEDEEEEKNVSPGG